MRIFRLVRFSAPPDGIASLEELVRRDVVPINQRYGCEACYVLHALATPTDFAIVSVWPSREQLDAMRGQSEYQALVAALNQRTVAGLHETLYEVLA